MAGVIDFPGGAVYASGYNTSWYGGSAGVYSNGLAIPNGRVTYHGARPILITAVHAYAAGRGAARSIRLEVGSYATSYFGVGAASGAADTGWQAISGLFTGATTAQVRIRNQGTEQFYFGRASSGGGGTFTGDTNSQAWTGALAGQVQYVEAPSAPGTPTVVVNSPTQVTATWSAPADNGGAAVTAYRVQVADDAAFTVNMRQWDVTGLSAAITGLTPGKTYYVRIGCHNAVTVAANTISVTGGARQFTTSGPPSAPVMQITTDITQRQGRPTWLAPAADNGSPVTTYEIQLATNVAFTTGLQNFSQPKSSGENRLITGLTPSTLYYVRVRAISAAGTSDWSSTTFTTQDGAEHYEGGSWLKAAAEVYDGTSWVLVSPEFYNGTAWID